MLIKDMRLPTLRNTRFATATTHVQGTAVIDVYSSTKLYPGETAKRRSALRPFITLSSLRFARFRDDYKLADWRCVRDPSTTMVFSSSWMTVLRETESIKLEEIPNAPEAF